MKQANLPAGPQLTPTPPTGISALNPVGLNPLPTPIPASQSSSTGPGAADLGTANPGAKNLGGANSNQPLLGQSAAPQASAGLPGLGTLDNSPKISLGQEQFRGAATWQNVMSNPTSNLTTAPVREYSGGEAQDNLYAVLPTFPAEMEVTTSILCPIVRCIWCS